MTIEELEALGSMVMSQEAPAQGTNSYGNTVEEVWQVGKDEYYRLSYSDMYPEGRHSQWTHIEKVKPIQQTTYTRVPS